MELNELESNINRIGALDSIEAVRTELLTFQDTLKEDFAQQQKDMELLRQANNSLWLQLGKKTTENDKGEPDTESHNELKYSDLFDDKGGLK